MASGVSYLHKIEMVHGDIKATNVLVAADGTLKIDDFDHAILSDSILRFTPTSRHGGGTLRWMAPELLEREEEQQDYGNPPTRIKQTDIYALGMTILEIFTGAVPYVEYRSDFGVYGAIHQKQPPRRPTELSVNEERPEITWSLLLECWDHDPSARPDATAVLISLEFRRPVVYVPHEEPDISSPLATRFSLLQKIKNRFRR